MLTASRPAQVLSGHEALEEEFRSARWVYHRLLDFEDIVQRRLDDVQEECAPGMTRLSRILSIMRRRENRRQRSTGFVPMEHLSWRNSLERIVVVLKKQRNADPRWKAALSWPRESEPDAHIKSCRRKSGETDEEFAERQSRGRRRTRREAYRVEMLYPQARVHYGTYNALCASCDKAVAKVLSLRRDGRSASWKRPRWDASCTIWAAKHGAGYRIIERDGLWWTVEIRLHSSRGWARVRAKIGNWHPIADEASFSQLTLTRRRNGNRWTHSLSILVDGVEKPSLPQSARVVAFDWGHREHQHDNAAQGIRALVWTGDDGQRGEILVPTECREHLDRISSIHERLDCAYDARRKTLELSERNRYGYRRSLMRSGVRTEEEQAWLSWEMRYERRIMKSRKRITNLRQETYIQAIRKLRQRYGTFVFEDESGAKLAKSEKRDGLKRRQRQNRDLTARYLFTKFCERQGATIIVVPSRNTTRECPEDDCDGILAENGPELMVSCPACGRVRDKDFGASVVILKRGQEALAKRDAAA